MFATFWPWLDGIAVIAFAITGCLVAARRQVDLVGFMWLATVTALGGGTFRDVILGLPVFWVHKPVYLILCWGTAAMMFLGAARLHRSMRVILWADAAGLVAYAVIGAEIARTAAAAPAPVCLLMGVLTATGGGILRDVLAGERTLIMRKDIYVTAAALSAGLYLSFVLWTSLPLAFSAGSAILAGFALRAAAILYRLELPGYAHHPASDVSDKAPISAVRPSRRKSDA